MDALEIDSILSGAKLGTLGPLPVMLGRYYGGRPPTDNRADLKVQMHLSGFEADLLELPALKSLGGGLGARYSRLIALGRLGPVVPSAVWTAAHTGPGRPTRLPLLPACESQGAGATLALAMRRGDWREDIAGRPLHPLRRAFRLLALSGALYKLRQWAVSEAQFEQDLARVASE